MCNAHDESQTLVSIFMFIPVMLMMCCCWVVRPQSGPMQHHNVSALCGALPHTCRIKTCKHANTHAGKELHHELRHSCSFRNILICLITVVSGAASASSSQLYQHTLQQMSSQLCQHPSHPVSSQLLQCQHLATGISLRGIEINEFLLVYQAISWQDLAQ